MEIKSVPFSIKAINEQGIFEGYAATWDLDLGGDILRPGAFRRTLNDNHGDVPILWGHTELIGKNLEAREDTKGLWVRGQINLEVQRGREAYALAKQGAVKGLSIGYRSFPDKMERDADGHRILKEIQWHEYSLTPLPMNPEATITSIKQQSEPDRDAIEMLRGAQRQMSEFYRKLVE